MAEAIITLPGGRKAKLTGPSRKALLAKAKELGGQGAGAGQAFTQNTAERLVGGLLNIPEFAARGARGGANVLRAATGNDMIPIPKEGLLGLPSGREAISFADGLLRPENLLKPVTESVMGAMQGQDAEVQRRDQVEQDQPFAAAAGNVFADAATVMSARTPFLRNTPAGTQTDILAGPLKRELSKVLRGEAANKMSRLAGRSLEAGLEGVLLSIVQGGDPIETAALAGGSQILGLTALKAGDIAGITDILQGKFVKGGGKLMATALAVGGLVQGLKTFSPGGKDFILESIEAGFDKIPLAMMVGAFGAMTGAGRVDGQLPIVKANLPTLLADAMTTIPRAGFIGMLRETTEDESGDMEKAIIGIISNPDSFEKEHLSKLESGMESGNFGDAVRDLAENSEKFRSILDSPHPKLADVPVKE